MSRARLALLVSVALGVLAVAGTADAYLRHGWSAKWFVAVDGKRAPASESVEHRVRFPNANRVLARYMNAWNFDSWGVPKRFPDLDAELRATLEVPNGAPRVLRIASPNKVTLEPASASKRPGLAPGTHPLTVRWKDKTYAANDPHWDSPLPIGLTLEWSTDGKVFEPVPSSALRPTASNGGVRVWLWFGVALALGALGWLFFARRFRTDAPWHLARRIAVPAVLLLATCVRLYDYDVMPTFRDNDDELFATWNGWQLLTDGGTRGWTLWPQRYRRNEVRFELPSYFRERPFYVVQPYLEHPPLLHVLVGIAAKLSGAHHWLHAKLKYTRLVPIALSVLATWLVMLVAQRLSRDGPAPEFAGLLYAVLPPLVLQQRVIKEETLVTTLLLGAMWLFLRWRDDGRTPRLLVWLGIVCGLGALTKLPAGVLVPVFVALVWAESDWRAAGRVAISGLLVSALVLVYGAVVSWSVFTHATAIQATLRHAHWNVFFRFFAEPLVNHNRFGAGWIVFLWIALAGAWATYTERDRRLLAFTLIGYLVAIAIPSGNWHYGWYFLPLYPILVIGTGRFLANLYAEPDLLRGALLLVLPVFYALNFTAEPTWLVHHWPAMKNLVTTATIAGLAPFAAVSIWPGVWSRRSARAAMVLLLATLVVTCVYIVATYDAGFDLFLNFDEDSLRRGS